MSLKTRSVALITLTFLAILASSYVLFRWLASDVMASLGTLYTTKQVLYNRARTLHPLMRELALARKLADSWVIRTWARNETDPALQNAALRELEDYRRFFSDGSYFLAIESSGHYYFNDRDGSYGGDPLRYTLDREDPEDRWFYATLESGEPYKLNVDYDEKLQVAKVWMNVVIRDQGEPLGVVGTGIDLSEFLAAVVAADQPGVTNVFVDDSGAIQAHDRVELIDFRSISKDVKERKTIFDLIDDEPERASVRAAMGRLLAGGDVEVLFAPAGGQQHLIGLARLSEIGWYNVTLVDTERMLGSRRFVPFAVLLLAALGVLCVALLVTLDRLVLRRVSRLDRTMTAFAQGAQPGPLSPGNDEIGRLERAFQHMAACVQEHTAELEHGVAERTRELAAKNVNLERALAEIRTLSGLLPICMYCKKIRDEEGHWNTMESYISQRSEAEFSHGICSDCYPKVREEAGLPEDSCP